MTTNRVGERERSGSFRYDEHSSNSRNDNHNDYHETYRREERRKSRPASLDAGGSRETHMTRRVRPKLDFLQPEGGRDDAFHDLIEPSQLSHSGTIRRIKVKSK